MIPYEELCAALERFASGSAEPSAPQGYQQEQAYEAAYEPPPAAEPSTSEHGLPPMAMGGEEEHTTVGQQPVYEDRSNEIDIGDVLSDEEEPN